MSNLKIAKQLLKVAKEIVAESYDLFYKVDQTAEDNKEIFYVGIESKIKNTHVKNIYEQVEDMKSYFHSKFKPMREQFKQSDFAKRVYGLDIVQNVFEVTKNLTLYGVTPLIIDVDYRETGAEYTWDATIDILNKYGFKSRR